MRVLLLACTFAFGCGAAADPGDLDEAARTWLGRSRSGKADGEGLPLLADHPLNGAANVGGCSGALFRFRDQPTDTRAYVLTNGHCVAFLGPREVRVAEPARRSMRFYGMGDRRSRPYVATELVYATMYRTDLAVYRLDATYDRIKQESDVDSLVLTESPGAIGEGIVVVSGYWRYTTACQLEAFVPELREGGWTFSDSLRYSPPCNVFGGTSGSPVVSLVSGEIVGVNNTGHEGGTACTINNPCEVDDSGNVQTFPERGYGQQTFQLYGCLTREYEIDLQLETCELPRPEPAAAG